VVEQEIMADVFEATAGDRVWEKVQGQQPTLS
jgi:hypothetical protein